MTPNLLFYQLLLVALVLICLMIHVWLPDEPPRAPKMPLESNQRRRRRSKEPKPFIGLIHKPLCEAREQGADSRSKAPGSPPSFTSPEDADTLSTPDLTSVPIRIALITAGLDGATSASMVTLAASLGVSFNVSRAIDTSTKPTARSFTGSAPRQSSSCASSRVWPKAWASEVRRGSSRATPTPC